MHSEESKVSAPEAPLTIICDEELALAWGGIRTPAPPSHSSSSTFIGSGG